ncbi:MAG: pilus assembly protein N-terminal domain-containing protein [Planctomycetota bacterium]
MLLVAIPMMGRAVAQNSAYVLPGPSAGNASAERESRFLIERVDAARTLDVVRGQPTILRFRVPPFRDQVGDPEIASLQSISESEISITGEAVGSTTVNFWFKDPQRGTQEILSYRVSVKEDPEQKRQYEMLLKTLELDINRSFPGSVVELSYVGSQVVVRGKAKDVEAASNILRIITQSLPNDDLEESVRNRSDRLSQNAEDPGVDSINPATGFQSTTNISTNLLEAAAVQSLSPQELIESGGLQGLLEGRTATGANGRNINNRVVNMLEIAGIHQVMLKVTLAEVVRDSGRSLISTARFGVDTDTTRDISFTQSLGVGELRFQTDQFFLQFDALKRLGLARSLSEPLLTTLSGQSANFLVGGQFPILESSSTVATVNQNIRFIPFGVQLSVLPTVTDGDRIRLQLQATVSETSNGGLGAGGNNGGGNNNATNDPSQPPSLSTRLFTSTVELRDGESMALAGLVRNSLVNSSLKTPFLGDIPVIGNIFSNNRSGYQEQELLVVVTPYLTSPIPGNSLPMPGSDTFEPDDLDFYLRGVIEGTVAEDYRTPIRGGLHRMKAFRKSEQKYIIGMPGHSSGRPLPDLKMPAGVNAANMTGELVR